MAQRLNILIEFTVIPEGSSQSVSFKIRDSDKTDATDPTTLEYKVYNATTRTTVRDWTSLTVSDRTLTLLPADTKIVARTNNRENYVLVVAADRGLSGALYDEKRYWVKNSLAYDT